MRRQAICPSSRAIVGDGFALPLAGTHTHREWMLSPDVTDNLLRVCGDEASEIHAVNRVNKLKSDDIDNITDGLEDS